MVISGCLAPLITQEQIRQNKIRHTLLSFPNIAAAYVHVRLLADSTMCMAKFRSSFMNQEVQHEQCGRFLAEGCLLNLLIFPFEHCCITNATDERGEI